ncbi:MAG TPA: FAD-dependent oxidoreductase [Actinomycetaceae bacterium]|nr:FAD-dependent oxidoreductase [Actinomycetaceae bacterium]
MRIVIVGGVAGGMSAAARARRLDETAEIVVLEKGEYVSFANCGLPYHLGGEIERRQSLLLHTPNTLRRSLNLDVRTNSEAIAIDRASRTVTVAGPDGEYSLTYDALILAPGAKPLVPPITGVEHSSVFQLYTMPHLDRIMEHVDMLLASPGSESTDMPVAEQLPHAVVVGAGFIGLESVEALVHRGLRVTVVEFAPHVLPPIDDELAPIIQRELEANGVDVKVSTAVKTITPAGNGAAGRREGSVVVGLSDGTSLDADLVLLSTGVAPNSGLAKDAGLELGVRDAIVVDSMMRTSDRHIWAVGDAVQLRQDVGGVEVLGPVPLAAPANRHGRLAADAIIRGLTSDDPRPPLVLATSIVRVFGQVAAVTGASRRALARSGVDSVTVHVHPNQHAGYYPGTQQIHLVGSFSQDGRLLGAQAVGPEGVDKRIDVLATALKGGLSADDLADLDLTYAPPFGSAKDAVNMLGFTAQNILDGTMPVWYAEDLDEARRSGLILDVRSVAEFGSGHLPEALNVPHNRLRGRLDEVRAAAGDRPVFVHCLSGVRSYLAVRILRGHGIDARNLSGGALTLENVVGGWTERPVLTSQRV